MTVVHTDAVLSAVTEQVVRQPSYHRRTKLFEKGAIPSLSVCVL